MHKTFLVAAALLVAVASQVGAEMTQNGWENGLSDNGLSDNGLSDNGLSDNGLSDNGLSDNSIEPNALATNGVRATGDATGQAAAHAEIAIVRDIVLPE